jgi:[acyl-carrier-protein] S-malonyltransferase
VRIGEPVFPVYANVTAERYTAGDVKKLLVEQVTSPVRWTETIEHIWSREKPEQFGEAEPGRVLSGLVKRIIPDALVAG